MNVLNFQIWKWLHRWHKLSCECRVSLQSTAYWVLGFVRELYECILRTQNTKECEQNPIRYFHDESRVVRLFLGLFRFVNIARCKINTVSTITVQSLRVQSFSFYPASRVASINRNDFPQRVFVSESHQTSCTSWRLFLRCKLFFAPLSENFDEISPNRKRVNSLFLQMTGTSSHRDSTVICLKCLTVLEFKTCKMKS